MSLIKKNQIKRQKTHEKNRKINQINSADDEKKKVLSTRMWCDGCDECGKKKLI